MISSDKDNNIQMEITKLMKLRPLAKERQRDAYGRIWRYWWWWWAGEYETLDFANYNYYVNRQLNKNTINTALKTWLSNCFFSGPHKNSTS